MESTRVLAFATAGCRVPTASSRARACSLRRATRCSTSRSRLLPRAGLYPDADSIEPIPNPLDGKKAKKQPQRENGVANETPASTPTGDPAAERPYQSPSDVLEPDVLKRARDLFGGVYRDEDERRNAKSGKSGSSQTSRDATQMSAGADGANSVESTNNVDSSQQGDTGKPAPKGNWFDAFRRKIESVEEDTRVEDPSVGVSAFPSAFPSPAQAPGTPAPPWTPDEIDVAAAEGIRRDEEEIARSGGELTRPPIPIDVQRSSRALWKIGWWAWWIQLVLTTISGVIVLFAFAFPGVNIRSTASAPGFVCAGAGVAVALVSLIWTYGYTRLAIRLRRSHPKWIVKAPERVASYLRVGLLVALAGMLVSLVGLQALVGTLLARLFGAGIATTPYTTLQSGAVVSNGVIGGLSAVQPVDVLVIQASANAMTALLTAIVSSTWLRGRLRVWTQRPGS